LSFGDIFSIFIGAIRYKAPLGRTSPKGLGTMLLIANNAVTNSMKDTSTENNFRVSAIVPLIS